MPIYEYSCSKCGKTIEVIQKFSDPILKKHQGCGGTLTKLVSASGFQFKGSGWYVTDYARKGQKSGDSEAPKETSEKSEKKEPTAKTETSTKEPSKKNGGKSGKSGD